MDVPYRSQGTERRLAYWSPSAGRRAPTGIEELEAL